MKKNFKMYAILWAILLVLFNAVVFLIRPVLPGQGIIYDATFWVAWGFIIAAFAGNLFCAYRAFQANNPQKLFYNLPLITISRSGLITMTVLGAALMLIPKCPAWIAAVICVIVLGFTAVAVVKASLAADVVSDVDEKVKTQTLFVKALTVDAESLLARAVAPEAKETCKKVYEAVRYSDPMSNNALAGVESQITLKFNEFSAAVTDGAENIAALADDLVVLIGDRNNKCKLLK